jgi:hypothetical protein
MKRLTAVLCFVAALALMFGWMLATPLVKSNASEVSPVLADGNGPVPPPPWQQAGGIIVADGNGPVPPPPWQQAGGILVADGNGPVPPPPWSKLSHARAA